MALPKKSFKYRYLFDIETGVLHDTKSPHNPGNEGCGIDDTTHWVAFNTDREPVKGALIKKLTATKEVVDIEVKSLCSKCMTKDDESIADLLKDYFLSQPD